jgi:hypothetical protein
MTNSYLNSLNQNGPNATMLQITRFGQHVVRISVLLEPPSASHYSPRHRVLHDGQACEQAEDGLRLSMQSRPEVELRGLNDGSSANRKIPQSVLVCSPSLSSMLC